jgi:hypothetical protein
MMNRDCTVCTDPTLCEKRELFFSLPGVTTDLRCLLEDDGPAALAYRLLLRLAATLDVDVSELMGGAAE